MSQDSLLGKYIFENGIICGGTSSFAVATFSGQARLADGTAAAPSVKVGDEQNGLYSPAANTLGVVLNGAETHRFVAGAYGVGLTPSAWNSDRFAVELGRVGNAVSGLNNNDVTTLSANAYVNSGAAWTYANTDTASILDLSGGAITAYGAASGTAGNAITWTQLFSVEKDKSLALQGATPQSGIGITFPATQSASSNANTLDDYEESTWVPTITAQTGSITSTSLTSANYTKIGRLVTAAVSFNITNAGTGSGSCLVTLPFTAMAQNFVGSGYEGILTGNMLWILIGSGGTQMQIRNYNNTTCIATNAQIIATVTYFV